MELLFAILDHRLQSGRNGQTVSCCLASNVSLFYNFDLQLCQSRLQYWASFDVPARKCRITECEKEEGSLTSLSSVPPFGSWKKHKAQRPGRRGLACLYKCQIKPKSRSFDPDLVPAAPSPGKEQEPDLP